MLENSAYCLYKDEKIKLITLMYIDFLIIDNIILTTPNCLQPIFNPSLYLGETQLTDIFWVLEKYQQYLENVDIQIPLINGAIGKSLMYSSGKIVIAQETLDYLIAKNENYNQKNLVEEVYKY